MDKRDFLKLSGLAALGVTGARAAWAFQDVKNNVSKHENALTGKRWAMVIDPRKCPEGCTACMEACHSTHNVPDIVGRPEGDPRHEIKWIWSEEFEHAFPSQEHDYVAEEVRRLPATVLCNHCDNPPCVRVCPTKATWRREEDGVVMMDMHRCIGCRFCMAACPYGSRSFNYRDPRPFIDNIDPAYPTRMKGVVEKCTFCAERLAIGKIPACVESCQRVLRVRDPADAALVFGDLDDPGSDVRRLLSDNYAIRRKPELGTFPMVYYIV